MTRKDGSTLIRWYWFYVPMHVAGSSGDGFLGKCQCSESEIRAAFRNVRIEKNGKVTVLKP